MLLFEWNCLNESIKLFLPDIDWSGNEAGGDTLEKLKVFCSVTFGGDPGATSSDEAPTEGSNVGEAGGAEGPEGDRGRPLTCRLVSGMLGRAEDGGVGRRGERGGDRGALCGEADGWKTGLVGGEVARLKGEGEALEKGDTRGELRGETAELSSALEKMKAVSVKLRW